MEKSWENFWTTGKVEDYLSYRNGITEREQNVVEENDEKEKGTRDRWDSR